MKFNSLQYVALFLPVVLCLYAIFRRTKAVNYLIWIASSIFYAVGGVIYLLPLLASSILDFFVGAAIYKSQSPTKRKRLLQLSVFVNLALLSYFKYSRWLVESLTNGLVKLDFMEYPYSPEIDLPPGISFYTFQTLSYTADIYRGHMVPRTNFVDYMSFVSFFPQLVAGPIERAADLLPQLEKTRNWISSSDFQFAVLLIVWGLFKKVVLADNFGSVVDSVYNQISTGTMWAGAGLVVAYGFAGQIYCDFSAYTDIARGSALLFGINLTRNFLTPYLSATPSQLWRRWHISLSTWIRDYVYIPLGGNQGTTLMTVRNLFITMFLCGLWHGAGILFILWGLYHGFLLALYRVTGLDRIVDRTPIWLKWVFVLLMFHLVCLGWIFFRSQPEHLSSLFGTIGMLANADWSRYYFTVYMIPLLSLGAVVFASDLIGFSRNTEFCDVLRRTPWFIQSACIVAFYCGIILLGKREGAQFIYFQF